MKNHMSGVTGRTVSKNAELLNSSDRYALDTFYILGSIYLNLKNRRLCQRLDNATIYFCSCTFLYW